MATAEEKRLQRKYYATVCEEFDREGKPSFLAWLLRLVTFLTPFGIRVNYSRTDGSPYQLRVYLTPKWLPWGVCLHHFFRSDQDPEYHNHPWFYGTALILVHGYVEHYLERSGMLKRTRFLLPWQWNTLHNTTYLRTWHRLELFQQGDAPMRPWTLFFHGKRIKDESDGIDSWGFLNADTGFYQGWRKHVNQPPSRNEPAIDVSVDPDPTPVFGTPLPGTGVPDTFDVPEEPTTPMPAAILKEVRDASVCTGLPSEPELGTRPSDQEGAP